MKIVDITEANGFFDYLKTGLSSFAKGMDQASFSNRPNTKNQTLDFTKSAQEIASEVSEPMAQNMAKLQRQLWQRSVQTLMAQTINPDTKVKGLTDMQDIPNDKLQTALDNQLNYTVSKLTNGRIDQVDKFNYFFRKNVNLQPTVATALKDIQTQSYVLTLTPDNRKNRAKIDMAWIKMSKDLLTLTNMFNYYDRLSSAKFSLDDPTIKAVLNKLMNRQPLTPDEQKIADQIRLSTGSAQP